MPESATPRRSPLSLLGSKAESQTEILSSSSENATGRDTADSESDSKGSKVHIIEKPPQIQASPEHASAAADGVLPRRPVELGGAPRSWTPPPALEASQAPATSQEVETKSTVRPKPIREISLRLTMAASADVDVQLAERAGKVQVAVRTGDQELETSLQANLGELVGRLEEKGFRTEAWTPVTLQHGEAVREQLTSANNPHHSDDSSSQRGHKDPRHGQHESNPRQPGRWMAQIDKKALGAEYYDLAKETQRETR